MQPKQFRLNHCSKLPTTRLSRNVASGSNRVAEHRTGSSQVRGPPSTFCLLCECVAHSDFRIFMLSCHLPPTAPQRRQFEDTSLGRSFARYLCTSSFCGEISRQSPHLAAFQSIPRNLAVRSLFFSGCLNFHTTILRLQNLLRSCMISSFRGLPRRIESNLICSISMNGFAPYGQCNLGRFHGNVSFT